MPQAGCLFLKCLPVVLPTCRICSLAYVPLLPAPSASPAMCLPLQTVDPRQLQISLTGFLEKNTSLFCKVRTGGSSAVLHTVAWSRTVAVQIARLGMARPLRMAQTTAQAIHGGWRAACSISSVDDVDVPPHDLLHAQELWQLLISANETGTGIPQRFLDEKAAEMQRAKEEAEILQARLWPTCQLDRRDEARSSWWFC